MTTTKTAAAPPQNLLFVEDEILIRFQIAAYLRECGFRVIEAANADEAMLVLNEPSLPVDIVLTAVEMSGQMDGFGLARWIRTEKPGLQVILAGSPARATDAAADLCESGPMLAKPYDSQLLLDQIKRSLADGIRSAANLAGAAPRRTGRGAGAAPGPGGAVRPSPCPN